MLTKIKAKLYAYFFWQTNIGEFLNKFYDLRVFLKNSFSQKELKTIENHQAYLLKQYHIIEKGLALPRPRANFGIPKIKVLISKTEDYIVNYGQDDLVNSISETLKVYLERNNTLKDTNPEFFLTLTSFLNKIKNDGLKGKGGVKKITKETIENVMRIDFDTFVKSRSSVRNFSNQEVKKEEVFNAVELARYAPSVCNRQSWKVHYYSSDNIKKQLLNLQNGNNGFTESIDKVLIVTTDTKRFTNLESNQVFVDGGLFAMNLLLSLHSKGIASCCLNTCLPYVDEIKVKKIGDIPNSERLIMMIGIGKYKEDFEVAISERIKPEEILQIKK